MASIAISRLSSNDLWGLAAAKLTDDDRRNINFSLPNKLDVLTDLQKLTEESKEICIKKRWRYTRKSGETVVFRDLFDKLIKWINLFKQVGDIAVQYDPVHTAIPWAMIRFILQIVVNESTKHGFLIAGLASIAEIICRYSVVQSLYLQSSSAASEELQRTLVQLYANVLVYLSKAKHYFELKPAMRILNGGLLAESEFDSHFSSICAVQGEVSRCMALMDREDQVHHHSELKKLLAQIDAPLSRMNDDLNSIQDHLEVSKRTKILRWLSREPYIQHHDLAKTDVLAGTGQWLLSNPDFKMWKNNSVSSILWLHGMIGSGKSKLVSIIIEDMMRVFQSGHNPPPAFFYCSRNTGEPGRSDPGAILASLARQLSNLHPENSLLPPAVEIYRKNEIQGFASGPPRIEQSCVLIVDLIEYYPVTTIVIDALDECDPECRVDLLEALETILQNSSRLVKIILSSRDDQDIACHLRHYPDLEISSSRNSDDIARFVKEKTKQLIRKRRLLRCSQATEDMENLIVEKITEGANGMFHWANLQLEYLCSFKLDIDICEVIGRLPPTLEKLYSKLYKTLLHGLGKSGKSVFRNVLTWLLCAKRILKTAEFLAAVSTIPDKGFELVSKEQVLELCNNFVVFDVQLDTFRFAHLSVREFLEKLPNYTYEATNLLAGKICLFNFISKSPNSSAESSLYQYGRYQISGPSNLNDFSNYANACWARDRLLAAEDRADGTLIDIEPSNDFQPTHREHISYNRHSGIAPKHAFTAYSAKNWSFHLAEALRCMQVDRQGPHIHGLVGQGLDMQMLDSEGKSLLHRAVDIGVVETKMELVHMILSRGGLVDNPDHDGMTCMHYAVLHSNQVLVEALLRAGFNIDKGVVRRGRSDHFGLTPLHAAVFFGRLDIARCLLKHNANVNAQDERGKTPIHLALSQSLEGPKVGDLWENDEYMVDYIWVDDDNTANKLFVLAQDDRMSIIKMLCQHPKIDLNICDKYGQTPLHEVQYSKLQSKAGITKLLVEKGVNRIAQDVDGKTPIHLAARAGDLESVSALIRCPEDLMMQDHRGRNVLHYASQSRQEDTIRFVLREAAMLDIHLSVDLNGRNALHLSLHDDSSRIVTPTLEVVSTLVAGGVPVTYTDHSGVDPLAHYVMNLDFNGNVEIISLLIEHGANKNHKDTGGRNLAHHLVRIQDEVNGKTLSMLRLWGIEVQGRDNEGKSILHHAAIYGSVNVAFLNHLQFCHHLDLAMRDKDGNTALDYAARKKPRHPQLFRRDRWEKTVAAFTQVFGQESNTPCSRSS